MSLLVAGAALTTAMLSNCSWDHPGRNPYRGSIGEAVSRYVDIPESTRQALVAKMKAGQADDQVTISRDAIHGKFDYAPQITAMHFGQRTVCDYVTRDKWTAAAREPAAVYCADNECLIVPKICGNVSRVRRAHAGGPGGGSGQYSRAAQPDMLAPVAQQELPSRIASADDVAVADMLADQVRDTAMPVSDSFMSPFGQASRTMGGRTPDLGVGGTDPTSPVPEPATWGMLGAGLAVLFGMARRRARKMPAAR